MVASETGFPYPEKLPAKHRAAPLFRAPPAGKPILRGALSRGIYEEVLGELQDEKQI